MVKTDKIGVIGAGIAGLTAAYRLEQAGFDVTVFEKDNVQGGPIRTEQKDGFIIDLGPNSTLETTEVLKDLIRDLDLEDQKIYASETSNKRYIVKNGELKDIPTSFGAFLKTSLFSWKAKLRLLKEPFIKPSQGNDISLAEFVENRLGKEFLDYAINPFVAGVYAGDPKTLSTATGFPKLYALEKEFGSLIKGAIMGARRRKKRKEVAKNKAKMISFQLGMGVIVKTIVSRLKNSPLIGTDVRKIKKLGDRFEVEYMLDGEFLTNSFDKVFMCVPTYVTADILIDMDEDQKQQLKDVHYPPVAVVYMGFKTSDVNRELDGFGFLVPEVEKKEILGSIWSSSIFPNRAPENHVAFTSFVGGTRNPANALLDDEPLTQLVLKDLKDLVHITGEPVITKIKLWKKAIPQYVMGYQKIQKIFTDLEKSSEGLYFAGNYLRGISVGDSVLSAHESINRFKQDLSKEVPVLANKM